MQQTKYYPHEDDSDHDDGDDDHDNDADGNDDGDKGYRIIKQHCISFGPISIRPNKRLLWCAHGVVLSVPGFVCSYASAFCAGTALGFDGLMGRYTDIRQHVGQRRKDIVDFAIERRCIGIYAWGEWRQPLA